MIVQAVSETMFIKEFDIVGREDNFSFEARRELFEYFNSLSDDTGQPFELDALAICCDFSEDTVDDIIENYSLHDIVQDIEDDEDTIKRIVEALNEQTIAWHTCGDKILYQNF